MHVYSILFYFFSLFLCSSTISYFLKSKTPIVLNKIPTYVVALMKGFLFP